MSWQQGFLPQKFTRGRQTAHKKGKFSLVAPGRGGHRARRTGRRRDRGPGRPMTGPGCGGREASAATEVWM